MPRLLRAAALAVPLALLAPLVVPDRPALAGGMFVPARGARALGRAGSLVAGVDDGSALYYNPAGLADLAGESALVDLGLVLQRVGYERVDSGGNPMPRVDGDIDPLPIPTLAVTWKPRGAPWLTVAGGVWTPYLGLNSWPEDGPQRYSSVTMRGSLLAVPELAAAFRITPRLSLGIGLQNMILRFRSRVALSACSELNCAPEDPGFDALSEVDTSSAFTPSAILGATLAYPRLRAGLSIQLPFFVRSSGTVRSRLPTDPMYANASIVGDGVALDFDLPAIVRLGVEARPNPRLRVEVGLDYEAWSMQRAIEIRPDAIYVDGVPGVGRYYLHEMAIARDLRDTIAVHAGGEWEALPGRLVVRAGYLLETSATPDRTASVLMPDGLHNLVSVGAGVPLGRGLRLDVAYGHMFTGERTVTESDALQLNPIQPAHAVPVGLGTYRVATDIVSAGVQAQF